MTTMVLYGDFTCPWSHLAFRRAEALRAADASLAFEWRAVEHQPKDPRPGARWPTPDDFCTEVDRVAEHLLPEETLPFNRGLITMVPSTRHAVTATAEAHGAGVGRLVARVLFDAYFNGGVDIGAAPLLRSLLVDAIRSGDSTSEVLSRWGYAVDVTGGPVTSRGWRIRREWAQGWQAAGTGTVPHLVHRGGSEVGKAAVQWLGEEITRRGVDPTPPGVDPHAVVRAPIDLRDLPTTAWATQTGGTWLARSQVAKAILTAG